MKSPGGGKALLFEQPTVNGVVSSFPVAINTLGSHKRMAMSMGAESVDEVANELGALMKAKPPTSFRETIKLLGQALDLRHAKPKIVKSGACKDVIHKFDAPPTRKEPWPSAPQIVEPLNSSMVKSSSDSTIQHLIINAVEFTNIEMLAARWRTLHHAALRRHQKTRTPANATSACIESRFTTTERRGCTGSYKKSAHDTDDAITRPARACPSPFSSAAIQCFPSPPPRRCRTAWMNFCSPVICAKNPSNS